MLAAWRHRLVALGAGVVVALVLGETIVRVFDLAPTMGIVTADAEAFARIPGVFAPSRRWDGLGRRGLAFSAGINSLGYRGAEPPREAAANLRVLFVGDSFVFGDAVQDHETWPAQLETALGCAKPVVVYNAGVPGATLLDAIAMADRARALAPHAIVAEFTASNDVTDLLGPSLWSRMEAKRQAGWWQDVAARVLTRSGLWNLLRRARIAWESRARLSAPPAAVRGAQHRYAELLRTWASRLRHDGTPLVFVAYPSYQMLVSRDRTLVDWVLGVAREAEIDPIDLWPVLARDGQALEKNFLVPRDAHPSPAGYTLAARAVARALRDRVPAFRDCRVS
jgi:lysophospholipase L1-like esterase